MRSDPPDVVLVVMDCVRYDLFAQQLASGALPFLASVQDQFLRFSKAVAPASWTIPSHASLFTGRYPWEHGAHYKGGAMLGPGVPTLAEFLREKGYRTECFSANGYVQPGTGLTRGFDRSLWGGDREFFLRILAREASCPSLNGEDAAVHAILDSDSRASALRVGMMRALSRFTPMCDVLNRVGGKVVHASPAYVGAWIEPEFDAALGANTGRPVFFFVNLLEAHEPYFAEAGLPVGLQEWLAYARTTQVSEEWKRGESRPSPADLAWSRRDYLASMRVLDERIRTLAGHLRARGRWENTLLILTSDHGQTFGEGGSMYHRLNLQEEITRIPLWVKPPSGPGGPRDRAWVSLVDVPTTVVSAIDPGATFGDASSVALTSAEGTGERTVFSLTDGLAKHESGALSAARREELDRVQVAAYRGPFKTILDQSGVEHRFRIDGSTARWLRPEDPDYAEAGVGELAPKLQTVLTLPEPTSVSQRIAGWGY
ncbi:MAG TPA: sulfatase-like hydrolase/transferase [Thermoplasmata archaeon]|nr:sulfatase-like hydrolase/transferase [Thermoplasmata archaeon]